MIISNTTLINNLLHLNQLQLLMNLFEKVHIPSAVADELNVVHGNSIAYQQCIAGGQISYTQQVIFFW